jgi:hypothetical protein
MKRGKYDYDPAPFVAVPDGAGACVAGWTAIAERLQGAIARSGRAKCVLVVDCYCGVDEELVLRELTARLRPACSLPVRDALLSPREIDALVAPDLGDPDPLFGRLTRLELPQFFDPAKLGSLSRRVEEVPRGIVLVVGCGARLVAQGDMFIYADLSRWEAQLRQRRGAIGNLGADNLHLTASLKYKRAYFIDWRVCDRWKAPLIRSWDYVLDTNRPGDPVLADGAGIRSGLEEAARRPFRVVPFFDPAPWGGQWLKEAFGLDPGPSNYGWGFDCVPEENSLLLGFGPLRCELPAIDLVFDQPQALLGKHIQERFGAEFPIRFDILDTMGGGNLSFQVHPLRDYIRRAFGLGYTQDESYYVIEAEPDASVYLGLREGVDPQSMIRALRAANAGGPAFPAGDFAMRWPAKKHDHFLIPAGTTHCLGADAVVLEISATPYIFTFKLWDWGRLGLDGTPRPVNLDRGEANIRWERTAEWTRNNLINRTEACGSGPGWREERTGLHESQFIETRRHWFTGPVPHDTGAGLNVLNLVEGEGAVVESPDGGFAPFEVHYAETFIVPASVGRYTLRPIRPGKACATIKALVRELER